MKFKFTLFLKSNTCACVVYEFFRYKLIFRYNSIQAYVSGFHFSLHFRYNFVTKLIFRYNI